MKVEATTKSKNMISSISSIFWGEPTEPILETEDVEDQCFDEEERVVVGLSCKAPDTPDTAQYSLPPGDPAFTLMINQPLPPEDSQEVTLLIERLKNGGNCTVSARLRRHAAGGTGVGGKALKHGNMNNRGCWMNKHNFCKNL